MKYYRRQPTPVTRQRYIYPLSPVLRRALLIEAQMGQFVLSFRGGVQ